MLVKILQIIAVSIRNYKLPKEMKENLVKYTAEVMSSPRKYGQGDTGVATFIKNLSENISNNSSRNINYQCSSNDKSYVEKLAKSKLDALMELRNNIAHPSNDIIWPNDQQIKEYINYIEVLAEVLVEVVNIHVATCQVSSDS